MSANNTVGESKQKNKKRKRSLSEFKAWLEGIEEMQGHGWTPDNTQWKIIREAIDSIVGQSNVAKVETKQRVVTNDQLRDYSDSNIIKPVPRLNINRGAKFVPDRQADDFINSNQSTGPQDGESTYRSVFE